MSRDRRRDVTRRRLLWLTAGTAGVLAGCESESDSDPDSTTGGAMDRTTQPSPTQSTTRETSAPAESGPDIGARYDLAHGDWGDCLGGTPTGGRYRRVTESVAQRHADAFRTAGIDRLRVEVPTGTRGRELLAPVQSAADVQIDLRRKLLRHVSDAEYTSVVEGYAALGEHLDAVDGLVVPVDGLRREGNQDVRDRLREAHGSLPGFVSWLRSQLPEFRLVAQVGMPRAGYFDHYPSYYGETVAAFDAVTNSVWPPEQTDSPWGAFQTALVETYRALRAFAREHSMEFEPALAPGIPTGVRACGGDDARSVPRNPDRYEDALRNAVRYATDGRVTVASFNDWRRGTQIEPGTYGGTEYGDAYLARTRAVERDPPTDLDRDVYYVSPNGSDTGSGARDDPLRTIQQALNFARAGDTVHLLAGDYFQDFETTRSGKRDAPIEITGPKDAVVKGASDDGVVVADIQHDHVHLTGCTFDGLWRPSKPDDPESYRVALIRVTGADKGTDEYLRDVRIAPHAIGNAEGGVLLTMVRDSEVGPFRVVGPLGKSYTVGDAVDHTGEVVYVGSPPVQVRNLREQGALTGADETRNIRIHHIDNSAGYGHSELVNVKAGAHDVTVEYCTDGGGGYVTDQSTNASIAIAGHGTTVRWNDLRGGPLPDEAQLPTHGISIDANVPEYCERDDGPQQCVGFDNALYGNRIRDFGHSTEKLTGHAVFFEARYLEEKLGEEPPPNVWPDDQRAVCGNEVTGPTHGDPDSRCPDWVPEGDGVGHTGGESPW